MIPNHRCRKVGPNRYEVSWMIGDRRYSRKTTFFGAQRFCERWGIKMEE